MNDETGEAIDARIELVNWALGELGDQDPNKYYSICAPDFIGHVHDKSWCGIFCLAGLNVKRLCDWRWSTKRTEPGFVWRLPVVAFPKPADIAVFRINPKTGKDIWHHAFVQREPARGWIDTVDGNVLPFPREGVATRQHPLDSNVTFYSIAQLLRDP